MQPQIYNGAIWGTFLFVIPTIYYGLLAVFKFTKDKSIRCSLYVFIGLLIPSLLTRELDIFAFQNIIATIAAGIITYTVYYITKSDTKK